MCVQNIFLDGHVEYDSDSTSMPAIHLKHEGCNSGKVNQTIPRDGTHGRSETETIPNLKENNDVEEDISEDIRQLKSKNNEEKFNTTTMVKGMISHKKPKVPHQEQLHEYESKISVSSIHVTSGPYKSGKVNQVIPNDRPHGRLGTNSAPNQKGNGGVEKIHLPKSKYDHGKIKIVVSRCRLNGINSISDMSNYNTTERKDLVIQPTTNISKFGLFKKGWKFKLNGMIVFTIGLLMNNPICTAATTEPTMTTLGSSVQHNCLFRTEDAEITPIIQFQNQSGSFKVIPIVGGKYERLVTRTDGETKITFTANNVTDADYGVYRCYLNNQPEEYKDFMLTDFNWISTNGEPIISTVHQDVVLSWEYLTRKSINKIIFSRQNIKNNHTIDIGLWTIEKGFKQNRVDVSTELVFDKTSINNGGGKRVSLELQYTVDNDFDKIYYCRVFYDDQISYKQGVELVAERSTCEGKGVQHDNNKSTFTWLYQYRFPITAVIMSRINSAGKQDDLGYWFQNKFEPDPLFKDRVEFNIKEMADDRREITLVLINTTGSDFNSTYICRVIPADGLICQCRLKLDAVDDLNHDDYTAITDANEPRDKDLDSNSTNTTKVAVIVPIILLILAVITV